MDAKLTPDQVKVEVQRYWTAFMDKNADLLMEIYSAESTVFSSVSPRPEPGRLAAARRQREYFHKSSDVRVSTGPVDVVMLGERAAVAGYTFQFHATRAGTTFGQTVEEDIKNGRATQVFILDLDGKVRIVHEHLSSIEKA